MLDLIDTLMNLLVFGFIGLLVWLYHKQAPGDRENEGP
jgi:hypothetical protein